MNIMQAREDLAEVYLDLAVELRVPVRMLPAMVTDRGNYRARERAVALCREGVARPEQGHGPGSVVMRPSAPADDRDRPAPASSRPGSSVAVVHCKRLAARRT